MSPLVRRIGAPCLPQPLFFPHAYRSRPDPLPPNGYTPLVPLSDNTPPSTSYGGGSGRERQPVGFVGADGRIYGLMEDQRRMWSYSSERPTWPRDYDHSRSSAAATGELPPWYPIGRRSSRAEEGAQPPSGDHQQHVVPRPEPGSSAAASSAYDRDRDRDREPARPLTAGRRSPGPGNHVGGPPPPSMATMRFDSEKPTRPTHHMVPPLSSSSGNNHTPTSTAVTDSSSKAPSISFLVNPSYDSPSRLVARESRSPPPTHPPLPHPLQRYEHNGMDMDGHHRSMPDGIDGTGPFSHPGHSKSSSKSGSRSDITAPGKRRIRNGACTFCREKKVCCLVVHCTPG